MDLDRIAKVCETLRFQGTKEWELQDALDTRIRSTFSEVTREASLNKQDRVDFLIGRVGVEVKIDGSPMTVARQLRRYMESDLLDALVLVTTRAKHRVLPKTLGGKPLCVVWLPPF
jgi:hypothetical protein